MLPLREREAWTSLATSNGILVFSWSNPLTEDQYHLWCSSPKPGWQRSMWWLKRHFVESREWESEVGEETPGTKPAHCPWGSSVGRPLLALVCDTSCPRASQGSPRGQDDRQASMRSTCSPPEMNPTPYTLPDIELNRADLSPWTEENQRAQKEWHSTSGSRDPFQGRGTMCTMTPIQRYGTTPSFYLQSQGPFTSGS